MKILMFSFYPYNYIYNDLEDNTLYNILIIDSENSLRNGIEVMVQNSNTFQIIIFNRSKENIFEAYGITSGVLMLFYSTIFWRNHPVYLLLNDNNIYFGTINAENYTLYSLEKIQASHVIDIS